MDDPQIEQEYLHGEADFGLAIRMLARFAGYKTQKGLAKALGVSSETVTAWIKGRQTPSQTDMGVIQERLYCTAPEIHEFASILFTCRQRHLTDLASSDGGLPS